jgi:hypothetical protein
MLEAAAEEHESAATRIGLGEWHSARRTCRAARAALPSPPVAAARAGPGKAADSARAPALQLSRTLSPHAPLSLLVLAQEQSLTSGRRPAVRRRNIARGRDEREESENMGPGDENTYSSK